MTKNSVISSIMKDHKDNWKEYFAENYPTIKIKEDDHFAIFNYVISADFSNPVIREARGIIIDTSNFEVVCWPFTKFCKYDETNADNIDWSTARIEEKLDGSIIKLWYNKYICSWQYSTNSTIDANNAYVDINHTKSFMDIIRDTMQYDIISKSLLYKSEYYDYTFIFELVSLDNQVVINYSVPTLYLIGVRSNLNGDEFNPHNMSLPISFHYIPRAKIYFNMHSLDECIKYLNNNADTKIKIGTCLQEGFVVVDKNYNRIKIKSTMYLTLHGLINNNEISIQYLLNLLYNDKINVHDVCIQLPKIAPIIKYYDYKLTELLYYAEREINNVRLNYNLHNRDRKFIAQKIKDSNISAILFKSLDNNMTLREILDYMHDNKKFIYNIIPRYESWKFIDYNDIL